jgi:VPDSG-CTERM motif
MKTKYSKLLQVAAAGVLALAAAPSAQAVATIKVFDGTSTVTITDGSLIPLDANGATGGVSWSGALGVWSFIVTSGTTKPVVGSTTLPEMHFSIQATSGLLAAPSSLTLSFSDDSFGPTNGSFHAAIGGALTSGAGNGVTYETLVSTTNTEFAGSTLNAVQSFTPISFSGSNNSSPQTLGANYALTQKIVLTHAAGIAGRTSSADAVLLVNVPDGGLTVALLGGAMVGLMGLRRKLRTA